MPTPLDTFMEFFFNPRQYQERRHEEERQAARDTANETNSQVLPVGQFGNPNAPTLDEALANAQADPRVQAEVQQLLAPLRQDFGRFRNQQQSDIHRANTAAQIASGRLAALGDSPTLASNPAPRPTPPVSPRVPAPVGPDPRDEINTLLASFMQRPQPGGAPGTGGPSPVPAPVPRPIQASARPAPVPASAPVPFREPPPPSAVFPNPPRFPNRVPQTPTHPTFSPVLPPGPPTLPPQAFTASVLQPRTSTPLVPVPALSPSFSEGPELPALTQIPEQLPVSPLPAAFNSSPPEPRSTPAPDPALLASIPPSAKPKNPVPLPTLGQTMPEEVKRQLIAELQRQSLERLQSGAKQSTPVRGPL